MDRLYSGILLAKHLLLKIGTIVGTFMNNRIEIPKEMKDRSSREYIRGDNNDTDLSSYKVKVKSVKKCFVISNYVIST